MRDWLETVGTPPNAPGQNSNFILSYFYFFQADRNCLGKIKFDL